MNERPKSAISLISLFIMISCARARDKAASPFPESSFKAKLSATIIIPVTAPLVKRARFSPNVQFLGLPQPPLPTMTK